jgi:hypothetical protein
MKIYKMRFHQTRAYNITSTIAANSLDEAKEILYGNPQKNDVIKWEEDFDEVKNIKFFEIEEVKDEK